MELITQKFNGSKPFSVNETANSQKAIIYSYIKSEQDSINLSKKTSNPLKDHGSKQQLSFKGFSVNAASVTKFFKGEKPVLAKQLLADITRYIKPNEKNPLIQTLEYDVLHKEYGAAKKEYGIAEKKMRITEPFHINLFNAFVSLPKTIFRTVKKYAGNEQIKKQIDEQIDRADTGNLLLGLRMRVTKTAETFDKGITGKNRDELKKILQKEIKGNEEELATFFKERKLDSVYSYEDGKASGILTKITKNGNYFEEFKKEILSETPKPLESSFIEKVKSKYVTRTINGIMESKTGYILPNYGQSAASFVARAVSGIIPAWFIAHDFYNLKILNTDNKKQADAEWNSKFKQETGRIGIETYQGFVLNSIFEKATNKSLPFAVCLNIINTIGSNVFSRKMTRRPILPISIKEAEKINTEKNNKPDSIKNTAVVDKVDIKQLAAYKAFAGNKASLGFGAGKDAAAKKGIINNIKKYFKVLDAEFANACPAKIDKEKFAEYYEKVYQLDRKDAKKMLEIAAARINETVDKDKKITKDFEELELKDILEHEHVKNNKKLMIGRNWIYRYSVEAFGVIKFPIEFAGIIGRAVINPVLKLFGKEPFKGNGKGKFYSEQYIKNVSKWSDKVRKKLSVINENNINKAKGLYQKNKQNFFSTKIMDYGANELSTAMKLTGLTTVPFLNFDAYNVTLGETKNKEKAKQKGRQRIIQDSSRQGVSVWIGYAFNQMGKAFSNASLIGNAAVIGISAFSYESFTRKLVGQPILSTTHEKMVEIDKERAKSKNWFVKLMAGRIKTIPKETAETKPVGSSSTSNQSPAVSNLSSGHIETSDLYKKFSAASK